MHERCIIIDFETRSLAGYRWDAAGNRWAGVFNSKKGLSAVGLVNYAEHPTTDIITLSWKAVTAKPPASWQPWIAPASSSRGRWQPGMPVEVLQPLFAWVASGGLVGAHNVAFDLWIWNRIGAPRYGFPPLASQQTTCFMATARVNGYPPGLADLGEALGLPLQKDKDGKRLIQKFSMPSRDRLWALPETDPEDAERFYAYCDRDCDAEEAAYLALPPMSAQERAFWLIDQEINYRGIAIDRKAVRDCIAVLESATAKYSKEFQGITNGLEFTQIKAFTEWLNIRGIETNSLDAAAVAKLLEKPIDLIARRALEIRQLVGSASVKKLYAIESMAAFDDRLHYLMNHHGARTGRQTGEGPQPLNLPKAGPQLATCGQCGRYFHGGKIACTWCGSLRPPPAIEVQQKLVPAWKPHMVDQVLETMATRDLALIERCYGDAVLAIMGCVRGLFCAGPGHELIASDYSAIEAVITAMLAGEQWRIDAFRAGEDIYLSSASRITGKPLEFYKAWQQDNGAKHPDRSKIGKVAELALGFGGWLRAWRKFDSSPTFTDDEVKKLVKAWRNASPRIVALWRSFENAARWAIERPGVAYEAANIKFYMRNDFLIVRLLSGRELSYPQPRISAEGELSYMAFNSNPIYGPLGWVRMKTYGGKLTENIVQAIAQCVLRHAITSLRDAGYDTVLAIYDEIVLEVPDDVPADSLERVERIMSTMPNWAAGWPIRAANGWRGKRFRKD